MKNSKFYFLALFLGIILLSYNYWGDFVKTNIFSSFSPEEQEIDYSWLNTYDKSAEKVLRNVVKSESQTTSYLLSDQAKNIVSTIPEISEKELFLEAVYKSSCLVFSANGVYTNELEKATAQIFDDYGFPSSNSKSMHVLIKKYQEDPEYLKAVLGASENCRCAEGYTLSISLYKCVK